MKFALIADAHSNIEALDACIDYARQHGAERFVFLGDLVGYNADPRAVVERVRTLAREEGALVLKGNHDVAAAGWNGNGRRSAPMKYSTGSCTWPLNTYAAFAAARLAAARKPSWM